MKHCEIRCKLRVSLWAISRAVLLDGKFFFFFFKKYSLLGGGWLVGGGGFFCFVLSVCYCGIFGILLSKFPEM